MTLGDILTIVLTACIVALWFEIKRQAEELENNE